MTAYYPESFIELAERLADAARPIAQRYFRTDVAIESKADASPVTRADREIESALRDILRDACPDHAIVGEEMGGAPVHEGPVWILDPIDGTKAFATGIPVFGTLIGLAIDGRFGLGIIDQPISDERWLGAAGRGSTLNGAPARVSDCVTLSDARLFTTAPEYFSQEEAYAAFQRVREEVLFTRYGADCYAFGLLASGFVDLIVESELNLWDFAALVPIVEGAGGIITDWNGVALTTEAKGDVIAASSAPLHEAAMQLLHG
ncbi:MAG: histidinol-phosphatase [Alphaproteobacteria bacterium]|nr:histidinol-phosphatase [Alphaproteobacteria bacterium]